MTRAFQIGVFAPSQVPLNVPGPGDDLGHDAGCVPGDDHNNNGAGGGGAPVDDEASGGSGVPLQPVLGGCDVPVPVPQQVPSDRGTLEDGSGLLQSEVLMQLISADIAGVAPIAKAAFAGQQARGLPEVVMIQPLDTRN